MMGKGSILSLVTLAACFPGPLPEDAKDTEATETVDDTQASVDTTVVDTLTVETEVMETDDTTLRSDAGPDGDIDAVECERPEDCEHLTATCRGLTCIDNRCGTVPANGTTCDDGDACTLDSWCVAGTCTGGATVTCDAPGPCRENGTCDSSSGACVYQDRDDGLLCETTASEPGTCLDGACAKLPVLVAGAGHVCAIFHDGAMHCWGDNQFGQLGLGHLDDVGGAAGLPIETSSRVDIEPVIGGFAGLTQTCAFTSTSLKCWGAAGISEVFGILGYADDFARGHTTETVPRLLDGVPLGALPLQGASRYAHACMVTKQGSVRCWGRDSIGTTLGPVAGGALGYAGLFQVSGAAFAPPSIVGDVVVGFEVAQVAVGHRATCARSSQGRIRCWGRGYLGYETTEPVGDDEPPSEGDELDVTWTAVDIAYGTHHGCAVSDRHKVYCWGGPQPAFGGLPTDVAAIGSGSSDAQTTPVEVSVGFDTARIATSFEHTCALSTTGGVKCWGNGESGQLGLGGTFTVGLEADRRPSDYSVINLGGPASHVAVGSTFSCATMRGGTIRCWGKGTTGRADDEVIGDQPSDMPPADVPLAP